MIFFKLTKLWNNTQKYFLNVCTCVIKIYKISNDFLLRQIPNRMKVHHLCLIIFVYINIKTNRRIILTDVCNFI